MDPKMQFIHDFILTQKKSAPNMTAALKNIGDGDMATGILRIAKAYYQQGKLIGSNDKLAFGVAVGAVGIVTGAALSIGAQKIITMVNQVKQERKELEEQCDAIIDKLESTYPEGTSESHI